MEKKIHSFDFILPPFVKKVEEGLDRALKQIEVLNDGKITDAKKLKFLIAFSGGPDSMSLLATLVELRNVYALEIYACHVNHHLRRESDADQLLCKQVADKWNVPLIVKHVTLDHCNKENPSEEYLRNKRYELLKEAVCETEGNFILTGHTLNDQTETILFRLFRGTSTSGLSGMKPARKLANSNIFVLRPMLEVTHADCLAYLQSIEQEPIYDVSNEQINYTRNFIRHCVIPPIQERFAFFEEKISKLSNLIDEDEKFFLQLIRQWQDEQKEKNGDQVNCWNQADFNDLPLSLKRRIAANALSERDIEVDLKRVDSITSLCANNSGALSLNNIWDIKIINGSIVFLNKNELNDSIESNYLDKLSIEVKMPGLTILPDFEKVLSIKKWQDKVLPERYPDETAFEAIVDLSNLELPLVIRKRRPGDLIRPFGMDKLVRLKKYIHTHKKKPSKYRLKEQSIKNLYKTSCKSLVLADQREIIWIPGIGLSNKVKVSNIPTHILSLQHLAIDANLNDIC